VSLVQLLQRSRVILGRSQHKETKLEQVWMHQESQRSISAVDDLCPVAQDVLSWCGSAHNHFPVPRALLLDCTASAFPTRHMYDTHGLTKLRPCYTSRQVHMLEVYVV
jgi:hypothetical protein